MNFERWLVESVFPKQGFAEKNGLRTTEIE
jgi:hypothetical protein